MGNFGQGGSLPSKLATERKTLSAVKRSGSEYFNISMIRIFLFPIL
jgi:hypothetical protein